MKQRAKPRTSPTQSASDELLISFEPLSLVPESNIQQHLPTLLDIVVNDVNMQKPPLQPTVVHSLHMNESISSLDHPDMSDSLGNSLN